MKKLGFAIAVLLLFFALPLLSSQDQADVKAFKDKVTQKVAEMKAAGVPEEEINKFITEAKKKFEQQSTGKIVVPMDAKVLEEKFNQKIAQMKAAGASDEDIKKAVLEFKAKVAQLNGNNGGSMDEKEFKAKLEQKAAQMRTAGASDEEIKKMVAEAKAKWADQKK